MRKAPTLQLPQRFVARRLLLEYLRKRWTTRAGRNQRKSWVVHVIKSAFALRWGFSLKLIFLRPLPAVLLIEHHVKKPKYRILFKGRTNNLFISLFLSVALVISAVPKLIYTFINSWLKWIQSRVVNSVLLLEYVTCRICDSWPDRQIQGDGF